MVDIRKLFNILEEACENKSTIDKSDLGEHSAKDLFPDLEEALTNLLNGLDELEQEVKERIKEIDSHRGKLDDILNSVY